MSDALVAEMRRQIELVEQRANGLSDRVSLLERNQALIENNQTHYLKSLDRLIESFSKMSENIEKAIIKELLPTKIWLENLQKNSDNTQRALDEIENEPKKLRFEVKKAILVFIAISLVGAIFYTIGLKVK